MADMEQLELGRGDELLPEETGGKTAGLPDTGHSLAMSGSDKKELSATQNAFNRVVRQLEKAKASHAGEQARLDRDLAVATRVITPLEGELNRIDRDIAFSIHGMLGWMKLTPRRLGALKDLISSKAASLLGDPTGLEEADIARLQSIVDEMGQSLIDRIEEEAGEEEFFMLREMLQMRAMQDGIDLDLSDLDLRDGPEELARKLHERLAQAMGPSGDVPPPGDAPPAGGGGPARKPTKAQLAKEQRLREQEEAKKRDIKTLYKQLAKVLHPDLEGDPVLRQHKESWMKRLTAAYSNGDLHDLLQIEMEWLGEEAGNLAKAGDGKLKVYIAVLKEQVAEIKRQTAKLRYEPQYSPLTRFEDPYDGFMPPMRTIELDLREEIESRAKMLEILRNGPGRQDVIHSWADSHARMMKRYAR